MQPEHPELPAKKAAKKPQKKIVMGEVVQRKPTLGKRFKQVFIKDDAKGVMSHVTGDVVIPAAKDLIVDSAMELLNRVFYGEGAGRSRRGGVGPAAQQAYQAYQKMYSQPAQQQAKALSRQARSTFDFSEVFVSTRAEGLDVIEEIQNNINTYGMCTVAEFYTMVDIPAEFTDEKWGWGDISGANVRTSGGLYHINLPRPIELTD